MDLPRLSVAVFVVSLAVTPYAAAADAPQQSVAPENTTPIDRGYGQGDACFGDKFETDDDLKTGNEAAVQEILRLLLSPGT